MSDDDSLGRICFQVVHLHVESCIVFTVQQPGTYMMLIIYYLFQLQSAFN